MRPTSRRSRRRRAEAGSAGLQRNASQTKLPSEAISAGGITTLPNIREFPCTDVLTLPPQGDQPQDGRERAGDRQIRAEVDADQQRTRDVR